MTENLWGYGHLNMTKTENICIGGAVKDLHLENDMKIEGSDEYIDLGVKIVNNGTSQSEITEE